MLASRAEKRSADEVAATEPQEAKFMCVGRDPGGTQRAGRQPLSLKHHREVD